MDLDNSEWEYNAPQFVDFTKPIEDTENVEEYFDYDHENGGIPTSFDSSKSGTPPRDSYPLRSRQNTPQRTRTPGRNTPRRTPSRNTPNKTPSRATPGRAALKDTNNLTPRRSNRIKSDNSTPGEKASHSSADEKENIDAGGVKTIKEAPVKGKSFLDKAKGMMSRVLPNIVTDIDDWNRKKTQKTQAAKAAENAPKRTGVAPKRRSEVAKSTTPKQAEDSPSKRLRRSVSSATMQRPTSLSKTRARSHTRTSSAGRHVCKDSAQSVPASSMPAPGGHVRTTSAQRVHARTNSAQSRPQTHTRSQSVDRAKQHTRSRSSQHARSSSVDRKAPVGAEPKVKAKLTVPMTPAVLKHDHVKPSNDLKTSEQIEMDQIKKLRKQLAQKRKQAEDSLKIAQSSHSYIPVKSIQAPTKATGFHFATDERVKGHDGDKTEEDMDFASSLRRRRNASGDQRKSTDTKPTITIPEPFHLHESKRKETSNQKYQTTAEILKSFNRTPDRFRSKPANKELSPLRRKATNKPTMTIPKTPNFETRTRSRPAHVVSQAELDEKELEDIKKYKFRAKPVNDKIFKNSNCGLHKVAPKEPTKFEEFDLESDRRGRRPNKSENEEPEYEFRANPLPKNMLDGPTGIKPPREIPLTKPASPAFALKKRLRTYKDQATKALAEDNKSKALKAKPVPHLGIPFAPKLSHKVTEMQPFSGVEQRNQMMRSRHDEKIKRALEDEKKMREFHATPLPSDQPDSLPEVQPKPCTETEPFQIITSQRAERADEWGHQVHGNKHSRSQSNDGHPSFNRSTMLNRSTSFNRSSSSLNRTASNRMEEELRSQRAKANFKAKPAASIYKQPFVPKRSTKNLTDFAQFELSTEQRRGRWAELQQQKHEKEVEIAAMQCANEKRKRDEDDREIKRLRAEAVHQAQPVRNYTPVDVQRSEKPLTHPETPQFSTRLRTRSAINKS